MSRPWIKLSSDIYRHPRLGLMSDSAWRRYVECLALAGDLDRNGALDTPDAVARLLYVTRAQLDNDLAEIDGRITVDDNGVLCVRDWADHQPPKRAPEPAGQVTARKRSQRDKDALRDCHADVTHVSRNGHDTLEVEVEVEVEKDTSAPVGAWLTLETAIGAAYGGVSTRTKAGKTRSWVGQILGVAGQHSGNDPAAALVLWELWLATIADPRFIPGTDKAAERFGAWCVKGGSAVRGDWDRPY